jgi:uncharacterized protein YacL
VEIIIAIISIILLVGLFITPFVIYRSLSKLNARYKFIKYIVNGIIISAVLSVTFAWWADKSDDLLLAHYGYNREGMNEYESYGQVSPEDLETVRSLEKNTGRIGWPLKAMMAIVILLPYLLVVYLVSSVLKFESY